MMGRFAWYVHSTSTGGVGSVDALSLKPNTLQVSMKCMFLVVFHQVRFPARQEDSFHALLHCRCANNVSARRNGNPLSIYLAVNFGISINCVELPFLLLLS